MRHTMGKCFRKLVADTQHKPLQIAGTINAYCALLAKQAGFKSIYLSGAGVANASFGLPDLGITTLNDVLEDASRITNRCELPLLVDADTGFGHALSIARTVNLMERAGVAAIHIEDQVVAKRCGHRPNKAIVSQQEMGDRIKAAVDARSDADFVIMARTDAFAVEGLAAAIDRANYCVSLGADMVFAESLTTLPQYSAFSEQVAAPILANITEFGQTPLFTCQELSGAGVKMVLYPLSAFRAMSAAALHVYQTLIKEETQASVLPAMQTRAMLYETLGYINQEKQIDTIMESQNEE